MVIDSRLRRALGPGSRPAAALSPRPAPAPRPGEPVGRT